MPKTTAKRPATKTATRAAAPKPAAPRVAAQQKGRPLPRPFAFHWGGGNITEEASFTGQYTEVAVQLLAYDGGGYGIRFCYYSLDGRFQRSPMMIDSGDTLEGLRAAVEKTPKLRGLLKKLAS